MFNFLKEKLDKKTAIKVALIVLGLIVISFFAWDKYVGKKSTKTVYVLTNSIEDPESSIIVDAPTEVKVGQLARLSVDKSPGKSFKWLMLPSIAAENFQIYDDGKKAVFSSPTPGEFVFIIACEYKGVVDLKIHTLRVSASGPVNPDKPNTPDTPVAGFVNQVATWAKEVKSTNFKIEATQLASSFELISNKIKQGELTDVDQIIEATKLGSKAAIGNSTASWTPFLENLQREMRTQSEAGLLVTVDQHASLWRQIAEGLKLASK
jgi:hypothetical protein